MMIVGTRCLKENRKPGGSSWQSCRTANTMVQRTRCRKYRELDGIPPRLLLVEDASPSIYIRGAIGSLMYRLKCGRTFSERLSVTLLRNKNTATTATPTCEALRGRGPGQSLDLS